MHLPIGISFYTFEAIAYLVDVFKKRCPSEKKFWDFALYVLLFPKVITGPISRYRNVVEQIKTPQLSGRRLYTGARRFGLGFCKKALLADMLGLTVDRVFALGAGDLTISLAWLGIVGYTLQIYYDFSGYTDMAIGLAGMLGFDLPENFDYPYITTSITEFWRRWHLSLSSWFRDYVFFPLERRFRRKSPLLQYANILIVFLLTGLWHGITANFLIWGLWHGVWMMLERSPWGDTLRKAWRPWQHVYALLAIMVGWVFFRAADLSQALDYLKAMSGFARFVAPLPYSVMPPLDRYTWLAFGLGIVFAMPLGSIVQMALKPWGRSVAPGSRLHVLGDGTLLALFGAALAVMAHATHQAYIYFRF